MLVYALGSWSGLFFLQIQSDTAEVEAQVASIVGSEVSHLSQ